MDKEITVTNCQECPFCNNDNEFGYDHCNLKPNIFAGGFNELPNDSIHILCPLRTQTVRILISTIKPVA